MVTLTGLSKPAVQDAAKWLESRQLIERVQDGGVTEWQMTFVDIEPEELGNSVTTSDEVDNAGWVTELPRVGNSVTQGGQVSYPPSKKETKKETFKDISVSKETETAEPQHPEKTLSDSDTDETQQTNRLTLREIKKLKLSPAEWRTMLDAENAEGQRKTVIEYIEQRLNLGPAAVQVYREISDRFPAKALWPMITEAVGDAPEDLERWRQTVLAHRAIGWNPSNIQLMIEFYKTNRLAGDDKNGQQARANQGRNGSTGTETGGARKFINVSAGATPAQEIAAKNRGRLERLIAAKSAI